MKRERERERRCSGRRGWATDERQQKDKKQRDQKQKKRGEKKLNKSLKMKARE